MTPLGNFVQTNFIKRTAIKWMHTTSKMCKRDYTATCFLRRKLSNVLVMHKNVFLQQKSLSLAPFGRPYKISQWSH